MSYVAFQYGEALFSLALERNELDTVLEEFSAFESSIDEDIYKFLNHPKITKKNKKDIISKAVTNKLVLHLAYVLIDNLRIDMITDVLKEYKKLYDNQNKVLKVEVYVNRKLTKEQESQLITNLKKKLNRNVELLSIVDETIVGGMRVEYEGMVLDETINNYLQSLKANLLK